VAEFIACYQPLRDERGRQRVVRNSTLPARTIQTGIGEVTVKAPRVRDRAGELRFQLSILPPYLRRTRSLEELLPWLYLKGRGSRGRRLTLAIPDKNSWPNSLSFGGDRG